MKRHAFTLVELLVVIGIISVLAAMLLPTLADALEQASRIRCLNNQKQLYVAATVYAGDFSDGLPCDSKGGGTDGMESNIKDFSMRVYASQYLSIQFYDYYQTVPVSIAPSVYMTLAKNPAQRGPLACPGSRFGEVTNIFGAQAAKIGLDYMMFGFGSHWSLIDGARVYSRMLKVGTPAKGAPKLFSADNLFLTPAADYRAFLYQFANNHNPANPQGQNAIAGDGSGKWHGASNLSVGFFDALTAPKGYWSNWMWIRWSADTWRGVWYMSPEGAQLYPRVAGPEGPEQPYFDYPGYRFGMGLIY